MSKLYETIVEIYTHLGKDVKSQRMTALDVHLKKSPDNFFKKVIFPLDIVTQA